MEYLIFQLIGEFATTVCKLEIAKVSTNHEKIYAFSTSKV